MVSIKYGYTLTNQSNPVELVQMVRVDPSIVNTLRTEGERWRLEMVEEDLYIISLELVTNFLGSDWRWKCGWCGRGWGWRRSGNRFLLSPSFSFSLSLSYSINSGCGCTGRRRNLILAFESSERVERAFILYISPILIRDTIVTWILSIYHLYTPYSPLIHYHHICTVQEHPLPLLHSTPLHTRSFFLSFFLCIYLSRLTICIPFLLS